MEENKDLNNLINLNIKINLKNKVNKILLIIINKIKIYQIIWKRIISKIKLKKVKDE